MFACHYKRWKYNRRNNVRKRSSELYILLIIQCRRTNLLLWCWVRRRINTLQKVPNAFVEWNIYFMCRKLPNDFFDRLLIQAPTALCNLWPKYTTSHSRIFYFRVGVTQGKSMNPFSLAKNIEIDLVSNKERISKKGKIEKRKTKFVSTKSNYKINLK